MIKRRFLGRVGGLLLLVGMVIGGSDYKTNHDLKIWEGVSACLIVASIVVLKKASQPARRY